MEKYSSHPKVSEKRLLPIFSNQKTNAYIKEIADLCGINKNLTFHLARHTFATTVTLSNGVPIESVSKMLGHKNLQTTQHYAKILDKKVSDDMAVLKDHLISKNFWGKG
ncbi:site-specific integrase [Salegentibacter agarivorans]